MRTIRIAEPADAREVAGITADRGPCRHSFETEVRRRRRWRPDLLDARVLAVLVCVDGERMAGYAYASKHRERAAYRWCVDVSVYIRDTCRRSGWVARSTRLCSLCSGSKASARARRRHASERASSAFTNRSLPPIGVYPRVGFKDGRWHDVGWWQLPCAIAVESRGRRCHGGAAPSGGWDEAILAGLKLLSVEVGVRRCAGAPAARRHPKVALVQLEPESAPPRAPARTPREPPCDRPVASR